MVSRSASTDAEPDSTFRLYRSTFTQLDATGAWARCFSADQLDVIHRAAKSDASWRRFLSGHPAEPAGSDAAAVKPEEAVSPIKELADKLAQSSDAMDVDSSSAASMGTDAADTKCDVRALAALVRRRVAIAVIDAQMLGQYASAAHGDDPLYEQDQGMMSGDDGGYTDFDELQGNDGEQTAGPTGVYTLLGSDAYADGTGDKDMETERAKSQRGPRKRPRYAPRPVLSEFATKFVREVRQMLPGEEDTGALGKLEEAERKAMVGGFGSADECVAEVRDVLEEAAGVSFEEEKFEELAKCFERDAHPDEETQKALDKLHQLTVGILGAGSDSQEGTRMETVSDIVNSTQLSSSSDPQAEENVDDDLCCWPPERLEMSAGTASEATYLENAALPIFAEPDLPSVASSSAAKGVHAPSPEPGTFAEMLGDENPVLLNVLTVQRIQALKNAILAKKGQGSSSAATAPAKPTSPPLAVPLPAPALEIRNEPPPVPAAGPTELLSGPRQRALGVAATSLLLEHAGFSHASLRALETLTDAWEQFIEGAGRRLSSARERMEDEAAAARAALHTSSSVDGDRLVDHAEVVVGKGSGLRGGFAEFVPYARYVVRRVANEAANAEARLQAACNRLGIDVAAATKDANVQLPASAEAATENMPPVSFDALNDATWAFGVLPNGATLDVVGTPRVPRKLALAALGCPEPGSATGKGMDGADPAAADVAMRDSASSGAGDNAASADVGEVMSIETGGV